MGKCRMGVSHQDPGTVGNIGGQHGERIPQDRDFQKALSIEENAEINDA